MRILVFGAGAVGSLVGGFLAARHDVVLVARADHVAAIQRNGLRMEGLRSDVVRVAARDRVRGDEDADLILLTTKAYDTPAAAHEMRPAVRPRTILATLQNGIGNYEALGAAYPDHRVLAGSITVGAMRPSPGVVRFTGPGEVVLGGTRDDEEEARRLADVFRQAGVEARAVADIRPALWQKAIVNAAINPLTALEGVPNGDLLRRSDLKARMRRIVDECVTIAASEGVPLPEPDVFALVLRVAERTAANRSSMLQDLERGRRTEIDAIVGAFLDAARRTGRSAPECTAVFEAVRRRERALAVR